MSTETIPALGRDEGKGNINEGIIEFEGIKIQTDRGSWTFLAPEGKITSLDTYSIWSQNNWQEIAQRLANGETCAMFVAGTYGVGRVFEPPTESEDLQREKRADLFAIKKRSKDQNFVAFIHPDELMDVIDLERLNPKFEHLKSSEKRHKAYAWAQHNVYPAKDNGVLNEAIVKSADQSLACFWIPNHWGFEGLIVELRKASKHGILGGGSLNIHGQEPSYSSEDLYKSFLANPEWLDEIDFIIFDEISEAGQIGRSQPMVSFMGENPTLLRHGSLSVEEIMRRTGYTIEVDESVRFASSTTPYDDQSNLNVDQQIMAVEEMILRFKLFKNREQAKPKLLAS